MTFLACIMNSSIYCTQRSPCMLCRNRIEEKPQHRTYQQPYLRTSTFYRAFFRFLSRDRERLCLTFLLDQQYYLNKQLSLNSTDWYQLRHFRDLGSRSLWITCTICWSLGPANHAASVFYHWYVKCYAALDLHNFVIEVNMRRCWGNLLLLSNRPNKLWDTVHITTLWYPSPCQTVHDIHIAGVLYA